MNPLTKVRLINELNEREARLGIKESVSWHSEYKDSAWVFIGGFPYELTEGDIICVFSQYGEIANINLVRDKKTGKSKGFCFLCYEDQRSTILAVDNFNGIKIKGRTIRVDHVANYRPPKDSEDIDEITKKIRAEGCAPKVQSASSSESEDEFLLPTKKPKKDKKEKKKKKKEKKEKKKESKAERHKASAEFSPTVAASVKKEKEDMGYDKYNLKGASRPRREQQEEGDRFRDESRTSDRGERDREREKEKRMDKSQEERRAKEEPSSYENREREKKRERDRGREDERDREREKGWNRESEREKERNKESEREKERNRESEKERERGKERNRESDREREREKERNRESEREREKEKERNRESEWERVRSKDRPRERESGRESEKERGRDRERERDPERDRRVDHTRNREYR